MQTLSEKRKNKTGLFLFVLLVLFLTPGCSSLALKETSATASMTETSVSASLPTDIPTFTPEPLPTITPTPGIGSVRISGKDGMTLVYVPEGQFLMGTEDYWQKDESPQHSVYLDAYWIDRNEVTNAMFAAFLNDQGNQEIPSAASYEEKTWYDDNPAFAQIAQMDGIWVVLDGLDNYPAVDMSYYGAKAYCEWVGRRLPTEAEWEKAARGTDERLYPWGNEEPTPELANYNGDVGHSTEVGSYSPAGDSPYGAWDMAGNVAEFVSDWYGEDYYAISPYQNPAGPETGPNVIYRGGAWDGYSVHIRTVLRAAYYIGGSSSIYSGFRCALDAD